MASFRPLCSLLVILTFVLGTIIPASHPGMAKDAPSSAAEHPMPADCNQGDESAPAPMPCGKVFCAGMAMPPLLDQGSPDLVIAGYDPAPDQNGVGLSRFPDPDPPRTISVS